MTTSRAQRRLSSESPEHKLLTLDANRIEIWVSAVVNYLTEVYNSRWFTTEIEKREGRLFFNVRDETPDKKIDHAQKTLDSIFANNVAVHVYLLGAYDQYIHSVSPRVFDNLRQLKAEIVSPKKPKKTHEHEIDDIELFCAGRYLADSFWVPVEQSKQWQSFWQIFSDSTGVAAIALKELMRGGFAQYLFSEWLKCFEIPVAEGRHAELKTPLILSFSKTLSHFQNILTKTFNDDADYLLRFFKQTIENKKNEPSLVLRIMLITDFDEAVQKLVRKEDELPFLEKLKELIGNRRPAPLIAEPAADAINPTSTMTTTRPRAPSMGVNLASVMQAPMFLKRQAAINTAESDQQAPEDPAKLKLQ